MTEKEAQSEAPSVDSLLLEVYYRGKDKKGYSDFELKQDVAKINRLIIEAELRGFDKAFDSHDYDGLREYRVALSNNLSKGENNG